MAGQVGTGALSYLGYGLEATKGLAPANGITNFLFIGTNTITATPDVIRKNVMAGSRSAERIIRPSKFKIHGGLGHPLFGNSGAELILAALGMDTYMAPLTGTAIGMATANGMSQFTTALALTPGAWMTFGAGATQELRQVVPSSAVPNAAANTWFVAALTGANSTGTVTASQIGQHKFSPIPPSNPLVYTLPTLTFEINEGGQWAWQLRGVHIGKYNLKGGKEEVEVSENIIGTEMPTRLPFGSFTPFAPTTAELSDVSRPFDINDGFIITPFMTTPGDNTTIVMHALTTTEDWEWDWDNGMLEKAFWDGGRVYKAFPGLQKCTVKYKYAVDAGYPDSYENFVSQQNALPVPWLASMALNVGTIGVPAWYAYGVYIPSTIMTKADVARSVTDVLTINVEADALITQANADIASIFVANSSTAAYVGS